MDKVAGQSNGGMKPGEWLNGTGGEVLGQPIEMVPGRSEASGVERSGFGASSLDIGNKGVLDSGVVKNTRTEAGRMGAMALKGNAQLGFGGGPAGMSVAQMGEELMAQDELERDRQEILNPMKFVGEETEVQTQERLEADEEDLRNEENLAPKGASEAEKALINRDHKIVQKVQDAVTTATVAEVQAITSQPVFRPADVVKVREKGMLEMLRGAFGYEFGSGN